MKELRKFSIGFAALAVMGALLVAGCGSDSSGANGGAANHSSSALSGEIKIDGSSTVFPVTQEVAENFQADHQDVKISVSQAGTGAGMKKFVANEIQICDASRPIEQEEVDKAKSAGIEFVEITVAFDGLSIVVNPKNTWVDTITMDELKKIWEPSSKVKLWSDVRPTWPKQPIKLYGPTTAHGTFEYFTEAVCKTKKQSRSDYQQCEKYDVLIQGVASDVNALGYVGFAYYDQNKEKVKVLGVDAGKGAITPSEETISNGSYSPLSRPLFIYVNKSELAKAQVQAFVDYYLSDGLNAVEEQGYIKLPDSAYDMVRSRVKNMTTGTVFSGVQPGMKIEDVLAKESS